MDADGRSFHLMLGENDWSRIARLPDADAPNWNPRRDALELPPVPVEIAPNPGERPLAPAQRRAAAADDAGNVYVVSDDMLSILVTSSGSGRTSPFWPVAALSKNDDGLFSRYRPDAPHEPGRFGALAVTTGGWLVAACIEADRSVVLLLFDLMGGGAPLEYAVAPGTVSPRPAPVEQDRGLALASCDDGDLVMLDREARRVWRLDRGLSLAGGEDPTSTRAPDLFQPVNGETRETDTPAAFGGLDVSSFAPNPQAMAAMGAFLLLLDRSGEIHRIPPDGPPTLFARAGAAAHDMVFGRISTPEDAAALRLLVVREDGNRAQGFILPGDPEEEAAPTTELLPLRRFGGRALVAVRGLARYDNVDGHWVPIVEKPLRRYRTEAAASLPPFEGGRPGLVWDRLVLDGCVPAGTRVAIEARASDELPAMQPFVSQPRPMPMPRRIDLPWHAAVALPAPNATAGSGSHMLLLQGVRGRHLELRLRFFGDGSATPSIRALRAWSPRVSWVERFLPAIYRAEPTAFLDRFLANLEGELRGVEERIAGAERLFDPQTAPAEALRWLADWFDVVLDPGWDEDRRRLFIANAERFFRWRGTRRGMLMALRLAFDPSFDQSLFEAPDSARPGDIRIVERFLTLAIGGAPAGDPEGGIAVLRSAERWVPAQGAGGLWQRLAGAGATTGAADGAVALFAEDDERRGSLLRVLGFEPSGGAERTRWRDFQRSEGRAESQLRDLPRDGTDDALWPAFLTMRSPDRERWQAFLAGRHRRIGRLNQAHGTAWRGFGEIALPDRLPDTATAQADWFAFETQVRPTAAAAHRFSVLLPLSTVNTDVGEAERRLALAQRIVALEKPAHTTFDVRFFWAMNRVGEARLGFDTALGQGSRAPELLPPAILGRAYLGAAFVGSDGPDTTLDRQRLAC